MKKFNVNFTRRITIEGNFVVNAKNSADAVERAERMAEGSAFGTLIWHLKGANAIIKDAEITSDDLDEVIIDDAYEA